VAIRFLMTCNYFSTLFFASCDFRKIDSRHDKTERNMIQISTKTPHVEYKIESPWGKRAKYREKMVESKRFSTSSDNFPKIVLGNFEISLQELLREIFSRGEGDIRYCAVRGALHLSLLRHLWDDGDIRVSIFSRQMSRILESSGFFPDCTYISHFRFWDFHNS
jgi:hypothetical protein